MKEFEIKCKKCGSIDFDYEIKREWEMEYVIIICTDCNTKEKLA